MELQNTIEEMVTQTSPDQSELQRGQIRSLLWKFKDVLSSNDSDIAFTDLVSQVIDTGDHHPIRETLRKHPRAYMEELDAQVDRMLQQGIVEPCASSWAANVVLVKNVRCSIDYRQLNKITRGESKPLSRIEACLDTLQGISWFCKLDRRSGYWQVRQNPARADKTAFITRKGSFSFKILSCDLSGAPSLFQRLMDLVLAGLPWNIALVYLDGMIIYANSLTKCEAFDLRVGTNIGC